ncbi:hypothetical protein K7I13_01670 [Brucepastera parasyntrophica]|uniref:hypothetical protein n=1 Tax=Brucepastera parasyntrophica TaxID=2880008 RepID=UPI00210DCB7E|nr:hypothetical protein [Brucepastera parasyntrophica]ULQ60062.1 hypothetical protein K7I13_01670 [Brucepastera parasyntrophica]
MIKKYISVLMFFCMLAAIIPAQTSTTPEPYRDDEFSAWMKDLRRAEIISFGSLPFVTFMAGIYYDIYRYFSHDQDEAYMPWPFKDSATSIPLTEDEQKNILFISIGISLGVALFDFTYRTIARKVRENRLERENRLKKDPIMIQPMDNPSLNGPTIHPLTTDIEIDTFPAESIQEYYEEELSAPVE